MAQLNISERRIGEQTVFDLHGDITFGDGNVRLRQTIREALRENKKFILLNFADVCYIDSSGVGELVSGLTAVNRDGGYLKLINLSNRARELLSICKLLSVFEHSENESSACP